MIDSMEIKVHRAKRDEHGEAVGGLAVALLRPVEGPLVMGRRVRATMLEALDAAYQELRALVAKEEALLEATPKTNEPEEL